jgi:xylan 1,4-beta-xylosidase
VPSFGELKARDTIYVGAALADDIAQCDGLVDMMSYWTFDDVFEENGPVREPFYGGFGLIAAGGINKPAYNGFALLHKLGHERIANVAPGLLVTRRSDGTLVVAAWNVVDLDRNGTTRTVQLDFRGLKQHAKVQVNRVDSKHGNTLAAYEKMGKPRYPTRAQIEQLNRASEIAPEKTSLKNGKLTVELSPNALVVLELAK